MAKAIQDGREPGLQVTEPQTHQGKYSADAYLDTRRSRSRLYSHSQKDRGQRPEDKPADGPAKLGRLPRFSTIGKAEKANIIKSLYSPLSGYLGGIPQGGYWVERLADEWQTAFGVTHAIPCNSATSGLLAACMAVGINKDSLVWAPVYTMSATAACAKLLGATVRFLDIEMLTFTMDMEEFYGAKPKAIIVTNLFGHPAHLHAIRKWCDEHGVWMIEDNAQAPFAMEDGKYAGTIGHIGVFSLNVHKHIQSGEGGVIVTSDNALGLSLRGCINHGELGGGPTGLNLRMAEPIAAIACAQLAKAKFIIENRRELALTLTDMVRGTSIIPPSELNGCRHVYYIWAGMIDHGRRDGFCAKMNELQIPFRKGYSPLLTRVFNSKDSCPNAEHVEDNNIVTFEICSYDPKLRHLSFMMEAIKRWAA